MLCSHIPNYTADDTDLHTHWQHFTFSAICFIMINYLIYYGSLVISSIILINCECNVPGGNNICIIWENINDITCSDPPAA